MTLNEEALKLAAWFDLAYSGKDIPISAHIRRLVQENERLKTPLPDEQIDSLLIEHDMMCEWPKQMQVRNFASAIEQAHGITGVKA